MPPTAPRPIDRFFTSCDGLRLRAREWGPAAAPGPAVVCLPGLARTAEDFDRLAEALVTARPVRVLALDYRGRGQSDWDPDWRRYDVMVENADILSVLAGAGVSEAVVVGTSRGGLHAMLLGATRPALLRGVVLNDIGPRIETRGLARIRSYVGKLPRPRSMLDAADLVRRLASAQFTALSAADWTRFAELSFEDKGGAIVPRYDPALMRTLAALDLERPLPDLWPQFEGLFGVPVLAIRGANSDLLSGETHAAMGARHPDCEVVTVPDQGHAPLLTDAPTMARIAAFADRAMGPANPA